MFASLIQVKLYTRLLPPTLPKDIKLYILDFLYDEVRVYQDIKTYHNPRNDTLMKLAWQSIRCVFNGNFVGTSCHRFDSPMMDVYNISVKHFNGTCYITTRIERDDPEIGIFFLGCMRNGKKIGCHHKMPFNLSDIRRQGFPHGLFSYELFSHESGKMGTIELFGYTTIFSSYPSWGLYKSKMWEIYKTKMISVDTDTLSSPHNSTLIVQSGIKFYRRNKLFWEYVAESKEKGQCYEMIYNSRIIDSDLSPIRISVKGNVNKIYDVLEIRKEGYVVFVQNV